MINSSFLEGPYNLVFIATCYIYARYTVYRCKNIYIHNVKVLWVKWQNFYPTFLESQLLPATICSVHIHITYCSLHDILISATENDGAKC